MLGESAYAFIAVRDSAQNMRQRIMQLRKKIKKCIWYRKKDVFLQ
jgi:hypothetical protein